VINKSTDRHLMITNLQDADGGVPFYWGVDSGDHLVVSDDAEMVTKACGKSFAPFPKGLYDQQSNHLRYFSPQELGSFPDPSKLMLPSGFFFSTSGGLQSYEHPLNEVRPVPRVDSKGEVCGSTYTVDAEVKKDTNIPRVGSAADWSLQC
jgi:hypothetical protein